MINTKLKGGKPLVQFKGSTEEIKSDVKMIMWSMIMQSPELRKALVDAIDEINTAVKELEHT